MTYFVSLGEILSFYKSDHLLSALFLQESSHMCVGLHPTHGVSCVALVHPTSFCALFSFHSFSTNILILLFEFTNSFSNCVCFTIKSSEFFALLYFHISRLFIWIYFFSKIYLGGHINYIYFGVSYVIRPESGPLWISFYIYLLEF